MPEAPDRSHDKRRGEPRAPALEARRGPAPPPELLDTHEDHAGDHERREVPPRTLRPRRAAREAGGRERGGEHDGRRQERGEGVPPPAGAPPHQGRQQPPDLAPVVARRGQSDGRQPRPEGASGPRASGTGQPTTSRRARSRGTQQAQVIRTASPKNRMTSDGVGVGSAGVARAGMGGIVTRLRRAAIRRVRPSR